MRNRFQTEEALGFDMTPMVDMVLLLLIFFMLVSTFIPIKAMDIALPKSTLSREFSSEERHLTITVTEEEKIFLGEEEVSWETLPLKIQYNLGANNDKKIYVRADKNLRLQIMVRLMDILQEEGIQNMKLATIEEGEETIQTGK